MKIDESVTVAKSNYREDISLSMCRYQLENEWRLMKVWQWHRVTIERTSPYKESYIVRQPKKCFNACFGGCWCMHQIWKLELVQSFFIFSIELSYSIFLNKASYFLGYTRIFKQQSR